MDAMNFFQQSNNFSNLQDCVELELEFASYEVGLL
jgi:hypothetical protein